MKHMWGALLLACLALILPAATYGQALSPQTAVVFPLRVSGDAIVGPLGQQVFLRGVNANGLVAYNPAYPEAAPLTQASLAEMASMGFDFLRLPLSLSQLEPSPLHISVLYLQRIRAVLDWAQAHGIWVLLDLHQDHYAATLFPGESDGMPSWMIDTLGLPAKPILLGITNPAVQGAFTAFWQNRRVRGVPLWQSYFAGLKALAVAFHASPALAGYDVMNEPNPGFNLGPTFVARDLMPFYAQAVGAIRAIDPTHPVFLEPDIVSMATGESAWPAQAFLHRGIVYEPHTYLPTRVLSLGRSSPKMSVPVAAQMLGALYGLSARAAQRMGLPWLVGEFGAPTTTLGDAEIADEIQLQDRSLVGGALWLWQIQPDRYPWQVVMADGAPIRDSRRLSALLSPHPVVVGGRITAMDWQPRTRTFTLSIRGNMTAGTTTVEASSFTYPSGIACSSNLPCQESSSKYGVAGRHWTLWRLTLPAAGGLIHLQVSPRPQRVGS